MMFTKYEFWILKPQQKQSSFVPNVQISYKVNFLIPRILLIVDEFPKNQLLLTGTTSFQQVVDGFLSMIESLAQSVEKEKMKAIGAFNLVSSMSKTREAEQIQLQVR